VATDYEAAVEIREAIREAAVEIKRLAFAVETIAIVLHVVATTTFSTQTTLKMRESHELLVKLGYLIK